MAHRLLSPRRAMALSLDNLPTPWRCRSAGVYNVSGWSGQFDFQNAALTAPGLAGSLKHAQGHVVFTPSNFDLPHFSATFNQQPLSGSYHYNLAAKHPERLHIELAAADLNQIDAALEPAFADRGLFARLPFTKRNDPALVRCSKSRRRSAVKSLSINQTNLGRWPPTLFGKPPN